MAIIIIIILIIIIIIIIVIIVIVILSRMKRPGTLFFTTMPLPKSRRGSIKIQWNTLWWNYDPDVNKCMCFR